MPDIPEPVPVLSTWEADERLGPLIEQAEKGRCVTVTRGGRAVARFVPAAVPTPSAADAVAALREFARGRSLGMTVREAIDEGRR